MKYGTANDADTKKLEQLKKQLEAQKDKQRLALDKVSICSMQPVRHSK